MFEILFLYRNLQQKFGIKNDDDLEYPDYLPDVETAKRVLSERTNFDYSAYLSLLKDIPKEEKEVQVIETCHRQFKTPFISKHTFEDSKILNIKFDKDSSIDSTSAIGISHGSKGTIFYC